MSDADALETHGAIRNAKKELDEAVMSYWSKNELRAKLEALRKRLDSLEKARRDQLQARLMDQAKALIATETAAPTKFAVVRFVDGADQGAINKALREIQKKHKHLSVLGYSVDALANKVECKASVPKVRTRFYWLFCDFYGGLSIIDFLDYRLFTNIYYSQISIIHKYRLFTIIDHRLFTNIDHRLFQEAVVSEFNAKKWIEKVCELVGGKCGGSDQSAQVTGLNLENVSDCDRMANEFAKLYL